MKKGLLLIAALINLSFAYSQIPNNITIKGIAADTLDEPLSFSTVMLLSPKDSTLQNYTSANIDGEFRFSNARNNDYLLKISHMNFMPYQKFIGRSETAIVDLGTLKMFPIDQTLMEVVIQAARAPLFIRGDTIEYDVATFKVPPGSTVEDLLRRLPGIEVDASGNISSQGETIRRVYVDGKRFFGDDPKSATKNLGAEIVSKVQVFDEKSEQARLTGIDDGDFDRAMNLELRPEFKTGKFGKATIGGGTLERWVASGNYNRFSTTNQLSFIGYANNINQTGVNWEDYGEFRGSNAFRQFDTGDFGFENRRGGRHSFSSDMPISFDDGMGLTKNFGSGVNYNYDNKGTKLSSSYFYNQTGRNYTQLATRQTFLDEEKSFDQNGQIESESFRYAHSIASRFEHEFNPKDRLIMTANFRLSGNDNSDINDQLFYDFSNSPVNNLNINNGSELRGFNMTSLAIYRHLFNKRGRSFALSAAYNHNIDDGSDKLNTINEFFSATTPTEQILQWIKNDINASEIKSSMLYSEPISSRVFAEFFYNFSSTGNNRNRQATAPLLSVPRIDSLSVFYSHNTLYHRIGSVLRYSYNQLNAALGLAGESIRMDGKYAPDKNMEWTTQYDPRTYNNLTPYASITYNLRRTFRLSLNYSNSVSVPDFNQLYPVLNTSNPSYQIKGNPNLIPEISDRISLNARYWNRASFSNINLRASYSLNRNPIVYNQTTEVLPGKGFITISMPENMDKGTSYNIWLWSNIPIVKTKLSLSLRGGYSGSDNPTRINSVIDNIISNSFNMSATINYTPDPGLILTLGGGGRITDVLYEIIKTQDQNYYDYSLNSSIKWQFEKKTFFESNFNYNVYKNDRFGFNQALPLWNASVRRLFGKQNRLEMRLAAFDILNKNVTIQQFAIRNYVQTTETNTLTRYIMLSMTYNIRGFETRMERNRMWF